MLHELKTWPEYFIPVLKGVKTFESRNDDRHFQVGDRLLLREWDPKLNHFTGRKLTCEITYKLNGGQFGIVTGWCVMAIKVVDTPR
jgi:hypothetical protein